MFFLASNSDLTINSHQSTLQLVLDHNVLIQSNDRCAFVVPSVVFEKMTLSLATISQFRGFFKIDTGNKNSVLILVPHSDLKMTTHHSKLKQVFDYIMLIYFSQFHSVVFHKQNWQLEVNVQFQKLNLKLKLSFVVHKRQRQPEFSFVKTSVSAVGFEYQECFRSSQF